MCKKILLAFLLLQLAAAGASPIDLDVLDDGKQIKLLVRHREIGPVCELWCYEGGPFRYGTTSKRNDGSVVFIHKSARMTATTTFAPVGTDRISMDILVEGGPEDLRKVQSIGPCMQFWHSEAFQQQGSLVEFARRCFLYTMRGPVDLLDTARGPMKSFKRDAPENNPPYTQWYVPIRAAHPGDIWGFGASGDRPIHDLVGVASRDGKWLAAIGCAKTRTLGQGWHDCIHHVADMQKYLDAAGNRIVHRSMLYVMPNNKQKLLDSFRRDFPARPGKEEVSVSAADRGGLTVSRSHAPAGLNLALDIVKAKTSQRAAWKTSPWGGFVLDSGPGRIWAYPHGEAVELWATVPARLASARVEAALRGNAWMRVRAPEDVPALVLQSSDRAWTAAMMWEEAEAGNLGRGVPAAGKVHSGDVSVRGRLVVYQGGVMALRDRWLASKQQWEHAVPYRMPLQDSREAARNGGVRFATNAEENVTYGLTIVPPWKDGGTLHTNFPEHFEHGEVGYGILRHSNKIPYPWKIALDGRSASYEVESPELPGVIVRASAVAEGDGARLSLKITNGGNRRLERVKPLLCFWYAKLTGFPTRLSDNFQHTYVIMDGKPVTLASIPTSNAAATAKVAYVRGCSQHDCDKFAKSRGGLIEHDIDRALIIVTARDGKRKVAITFTPGKSILSNAFIPCAHADPFYGTVEPGSAAEATGEVLFTDRPIDEILRTFVNRRAGEAAATSTTAR
jgi:hypothetical protein